MEAAEAAKRTKYAEYFRGYKELGFAPFALDLSGGMGPEAWRILGELGRLTAQQPRSYRTRGQAVEENVSEIAWTFVDEVTREIDRAMRRRTVRDQR